MNPYRSVALICFIVAFAASGTAAVAAATHGTRWAAYLFTSLAVVSMAAFTYGGIQ